MATKNSSSARSGARAEDLVSDTAVEFTAEIETIGMQGDGIALVGGRKVFIPYALPGEIVRAQEKNGHSELLSVVAPAPARVAPLCTHFGKCGGCVAQHMDRPSYDAWKKGLVTQTLARAGLAFPAPSFQSYPVSSRRRASLNARRNGGRVQLGFQQARSHALVDLAECPVLIPELMKCLGPLRDVFSGALRSGQTARAQLTASANGIDCAVEGPKLSPGNIPGISSALSSTAIIRFTWNGEIALLKELPFVRFGPAEVTLPPGAFLQAVAAAESDMANFVTEAVGKTSGPVCDLFAGLGAFSFPCATKAPVRAFESTATAVEAMKAAVKRARNIKPVQVTRRDLFRNPLGPLELNTYGAAVLDPPREGAEAQCRAILGSKLSRVIMLSCNPMTFARDARLLADGGFVIEKLAIFDQFIFSEHVELAALMRRDAKSGKRGR